MSALLIMARLERSRTRVNLTWYSFCWFRVSLMARCAGSQRPHIRQANQPHEEDMAKKAKKAKKTAKATKKVAKKTKKMKK